MDTSRSVSIYHIPAKGSNKVWSTSYSLKEGEVLVDNGTTLSVMPYTRVKALQDDEYAKLYPKLSKAN